MASVNVTSFVQQRQIGNSGGRKKKHVESFLEEKGLTSLINKVISAVSREHLSSCFRPGLTQSRLEISVLGRRGIGLSI